VCISIELLVLRETRRGESVCHLHHPYDFRNNRSASPSQPTPT
jgi:hypothetical protein